MKRVDSAAVNQRSDAEQQARRKFLKQAGKIAVTAPAVTLLLSAASKPVSAMYTYDPGGWIP